MPNDHSHVSKLLAEIAPRHPGDGEIPDDEGTALSSRGVGQAPMLQLRLKNGAEVAAPYPYMAWADYDPEIGITLEFPTRHVVIKGHALGHLFRQIAEHKRTVVEELTTPSRRLATHEDRSAVSEILITEPKTKSREGEVEP
jgi:hypothetical protein